MYCARHDFGTYALSRTGNLAAVMKTAREQIAKHQDKAVQFLRDVADDPDLADEIDDLSVEEYAQRKGFEVASNPSKRRKGAPMKAEQVKEWISEAAKGWSQRRFTTEPPGESERSGRSTDGRDSS